MSAAMGLDNSSDAAVLIDLERRFYIHSMQ